MKALLIAIAVTLAAPAAAFGSGPTMTVRDVSLHGGRTLASSIPRFNLVGLHWRGAGGVQFRTRSSGRWTAWQTADDDDNRAAGWRLGNIVWTDTASAIRFRTTGPVTALRSYTIWSPTEKTPARRIATANAPPIIPRLSWGADESIKRAAPQYVPAIKYAVVHHTAGSNNYTQAQSASIVRGIYLYHVKGNGWNDIGYNFLVDKYGQVFEGRFGGYDKAVVGAHAEGFNTGSVGVSVLGSYGTSKISSAAETALEQLLAWRLDVAHIDPLSTLTVASGGNPRFGAGVPVNLRAISGHRDTGFTDCPGNAFYAQLPEIARAVAALGGPKVYAPLATGKLEGPIRFTGRLSASLPWTVTVADPTGATVAQGTGVGTTIDWTWNALAVPVQRYTWTMTTPNARAATGAIGAATSALAVQKALATPTLLSPGGDPSDDATTISYTLTAPATVTASLVNALGQSLSTLFTEAKAAGAQTFTFTATPGLLSGSYTIQLLAATANGKSVTASVPFTVDDSLDGFVSASAPKGASASVTFNLMRGSVTTQLEVKQGEAVVATLPQETLEPGPQTVTWNRTLDDGSRAPDGTYTLSLEVLTPFSSFTRTADVTLDSTPPKVTALSYKNMRFRVTEPVKLTLIVGTTKHTRTLKKATTTQFWLKVKPKAYRLVATDAAGNATVVRYRAVQAS